VRPCVFMCVCVCARARLVHATRGLHSNASHTHVSLPQASLEEVQAAINRAATTVLQCAKRLWDWGEGGKPAASPRQARARPASCASRDIEIVRVVLLLLPRRCMWRRARGSRRCSAFVWGYVFL
jgi:hypothetical protein